MGLYSCCQRKCSQLCLYHSAVLCRRNHLVWNIYKKNFSIGKVPSSAKPSSSLVAWDYSNSSRQKGALNSLKSVLLVAARGLKSHRLLRRKMEYVPPRCMIALTKPESCRPEHNSSEQSAEVILFLACFDSAKNRPRSLAFKRSLDEPWTVFLAKLRSKVLVRSDQQQKKKKQRRLVATGATDSAEAFQELDEDIISINTCENILEGQNEDDLTLSKVLEIVSEQRNRNGWNPKLIRIGDVEYRMVINPLQVEILKMNLDMIPGFPSMASPNFRLSDGSSSYYNADAKFLWYARDSPLDHRFDISQAIIQQTEAGRHFQVPGWKLVAESRMFVPEAVHAGAQICVVCDPGEDSIVKCVVPTRPVAAVPDEPFIWESRQALPKPTTSSSKSQTIRVLTYNVLADMYMNLKQEQEQLWFPFCPKKYQEYSYRYPLLLREIPGYEADILCLQEVDYRLWDRFLAHRVIELGWDSDFLSKGCQVHEGLATLYRSNSFKKLESRNVLLTSLLEKESAGNEDLAAWVAQSESVKEKVMSRPTVLQTNVLETRSGQVLVVANTHLHSRPEDDYIRLLQTALCVRHLHAVLLQLQIQFPSRQVGLLFCGDLNSTPTSAAIRFLSSGFMSGQDSAWMAEEQISEGVQLRTELELVDAADSTADPDYFTNFSLVNDKGFKGCLDYVWTTPGFEATALPMPSHDLVTKYGALPSKIAPSDHLPVIVDLVLRT